MSAPLNKQKTGQGICFPTKFSKPEQKYIHPVGVNRPDECFRLLFNSFASIAISSALGLDDYENWVMESNMLNAYQKYKVQLQILSLNNRKHSWHV